MDPGGNRNGSPEMVFVLIPASFLPMLGPMEREAPQIEPTPTALPDESPPAAQVSEKLTRFQEGLSRGDFRSLSEWLSENVSQPDPVLQRFLAQKRFDFRIDRVALWIFLIGGLVWVGIAAASLFH